MLKWEHIAAWRTYAPATRLVNEYGPTETVVGCCVYEVTDESVRSGSVPIGRAIDNMEMYLLGPDRKPVPPGETGELYIGGIGVGRGYLNQPETTEAKFITLALDGKTDVRLYRTGDLARALPDGNLEYLGRTDHQVKVRGYRIELGEIEVALGQHPEVRDCVVVARADAAAGARLAAYVVAKKNSAPAIDGLRSFLRERLPAYMVPSAFLLLEAFPLTVNGKIDRDALPAPEAQRPAAGRPFKAPTDSLEIQLAEIWEDILGTRPIGVSDDFFELGGDSLQAVLMATRVEEIRGRHIPPSMLLTENTIEKLAKAIHELDLAPQPATVVPVQPRGNLPPLYLVPGIGGMALGLSYLAQHLGKDQPLYGLQARGVRDAEIPCATIEEMACYFIDAILAVQPEGPYFIGGYSFGGLVAFEMARRLYALGRQIGIAAILDTVAPGSDGFRFVHFMRNLPHWLADFIAQPEARSVLGKKLQRLAANGINRIFRPLGFEPFEQNIADVVGVDSKTPQKYLDVIEAHYHALGAYRPGSLPGCITLFRTKAQPLFRAHPDNGWGRLVDGEIEIYDVGGNHLNFMQEPYVRTLATQIRAALEKSRKPTTPRVETVAAAPIGGRNGSHPEYSRAPKPWQIFPDR
jgi:thioesterase domain-containing protein/acyl carrier protein